MKDRPVSFIGGHPRAGKNRELLSILKSMPDTKLLVPSQEVKDAYVSMGASPDQVVVMPAILKSKQDSLLPG